MDGNNGIYMVYWGFTTYYENIRIKPLHNNGKSNGYRDILITLWWINIDPENHQFLVEINLPTPICQGLCEFTGG